LGPKCIFRDVRLARLVLELRSRDNFEMVSFVRSCRELLQRPFAVLVVSTVFALSAVVLDGTLFRIWSLNRDQTRLENRIAALRQSVADKERHLVEVNRPEFIERQAREQLDFVRDGDLVFVFSDTASQ
jgi:cell division protein FtsB